MLKTSVLPVRDALRAQGLLKPNEPYAIGLRLSALSAKELLESGALPDFKQWLEDEQCYVFTINGFPYGQFHSTRVKEDVYRPDWQTRERVEYTSQLFEIIGQLVPEGVAGSVSTSPASCKGFEVNLDPILDHYAEVAQVIEVAALKYDRDLHLGIEPEPYCYLETTPETVAFFEQLRAKFPDLSEVIARRIGVNYDTCHMAIQYERASESLAAFQTAGIRLSKLHLSNAPTLSPKKVDELEIIRGFDEPTYLHQVHAKTSSGEILRYKDLPDALACDRAVEAEEWRVHFHIPLYANEGQLLGSTSEHLAEALAFLNQYPNACEHLEMETYTWGVMPEHLAESLTSQIVGEYRWVLNEREKATEGA